MLPHVSVIIPNYNGRRWLEPCLNALFAQSYPNLSVVLVDNGSRDDSVEFVTQRFPLVHCLTHETNQGFAAAINTGIRATDTPLVATLNNDTVVESNWLIELVEPLLADEQSGIAASKLLFAEPAGCVNSAGISLDRVGIPWDRLGGQPDDISEQTIASVFGACAGAALYRRAMLDEIGLFDEDYFAYMEDVDLAWRAQLAGWHAIYVPTARVMHWHSATSIEGSPFKNRLLGRNKIWLIAKNYPSPYLWLYLPAIIAYDVAAVAYAVCVRGQWSSLHGRLQGLWGLPHAWRKRQRVQALRRVPASGVIARMEPIANPLNVLRRYLHLKAKR